MVREYGTSFRWRIVFLHEISHLLPREIADILCIGKTFVHKILKLYRETKGVDNDYALRVRGRSRIMNGKFIYNYFLLKQKKLRSPTVIFSARDLLFIRRLVNQYPELYLDELRDWVHFQIGRLFSLATISRTLRKMGLSIVKVMSAINYLFYFDSINSSPT